MTQPELPDFWSEPEPNREPVTIRFQGGPYDGLEGSLPFLPTFMTLHAMDGEWGRKDGKFVMDTRLSDYVYLLRFPEGEDGPAVYVLRPKVDLGDWLYHSP